MVSEHGSQVGELKSRREEEFRISTKTAVRNPLEAAQSLGYEGQFLRKIYFS